MAAALCSLMLVTGCATVANPDPRDPWEGYNRGVTRFNDTVDDAVIKPVATVYKELLPQPVRTGVGNFFGNLSDAWSFVNNVLQAKPEGALTSFWRVAINSTIGLGGLLDPATEMRLERQREDFGQTLGYWGVPPGPYFVLPILGPSSVRDTAALPVDIYGQPLTHVNDVPWRNSLRATQIIHTRSQLLEASDILDSAALDAYTFRRDAYFQKRRNDIYDGNPPQDEERYDLDEPEAEPAAGAASSARPARTPSPRQQRRATRPAAAQATPARP
jgi:phospholipid-binding lipoprotein MlaA